ncbi:uncharacterized protein LOC105445739 [Strongylocentrotus purpuratus]|uniref:C2H2-type domain-containing protein n=1 Tax=Strongylocentrotus purpuratus TaxID=7668 RepID=A0A7M7PW70_STRPU|nr:uncharacterized protein LOC105445739 [Strongylocentrotus purpuratus]XP_030856197.1 uncharacterized protein LOC105445739 [Strongylocentrotus purpuratus]
MHKCTASSINNECANLCSDPLKSSFGNTTKQKLQQWSYQAQEEELQEKAPTLLTCIKAAAVSPGIEAGNRANPRKTYRSIQPGILGAAGVLLNARNERMNSHQVMNALSVRRGGCGFKTISRLKARGFSVSYKTILRKQVEFGKDYNAKVLEWKETIEKDVQKENDLLKDPDGKSALLKHNAERHRGFMLNGDNVDFRISPRQMTIAQGTTDLHYFQFLAVKNRVADFSLSSDGPKRDVEKEPLSTFLPSVEDNADLREDWLHLIAQVIGKNIPPLCWMSSVLPEHIPHPFMKEMKKKSEVVNLGVLTSNENTHEGMVEILDHMNKYVPVETDGTTPVKIISGGDLLTCERETNTILDRQDSPSPMARWDGLVPVIDDFHTMANFLSAIWTLLYSTSSARDTGTMYAARNFLRAHNVSNDPMKDINASVEFLDKYTEALIVCAALEHFGMEAVTSEPTKHPYDPMTMDPTVYVKEQLHSIVDKFALHEGPDFAKQADYVCPHCQKVYKRLSGIRKHMEDKHSQQAPQASSDTSTQDGEDSVYNYSCASVSICLLFRDFQDARRYGDGARLIRLYKYLLLYFKRTHRTKYSFQSLRLLAQVECMLSPRLAFELTWNRFVNKEGKADTNKEVDRENEHQNKVLKGECKQFNGKISEASVERVSHSAQEIEEILVTCDNVSHVQRKKGLHAGKDTTGDVQKLATAMHKERIFQEKQSRRHHAFPSYPKNPLTQLDLPDLQRWMKATLKKPSCRL